MAVFIYLIQTSVVHMLSQMSEAPLSRGVDLYTFGWALGPPNDALGPPNVATSPSPFKQVHLHRTADN